MPTTTKASQPMCDGCWGTPPLRPSGTAFARHAAGDGSTCKGKPVAPVQGADNGKQECPECGKHVKPLSSGKALHKHADDNGETCQQREDTRKKCPSCSRRIGLKQNKFAVHRDLVKGTKCTGSAQPPDHDPIEPFAGARPSALPKERPAKRPPAPKGVDAAVAKAQAFSALIATHGWKTAVEQDLEALTATAEATRGEEMITITWEEARCVGGTIFHTYKSRKIALRNKNAAVQRASMSPEQILVEHARVSHRAKKSPTPTAKRTLRDRPAEEISALRALMPFDPRTAEQEEIARSIAGKDITWHNRTSGKDETGTVNANLRAIKLAKSKADGSRQVTFFLLNRGAKTIRLADLVSVG